VFSPYGSVGLWARQVEQPLRQMALSGDVRRAKLGL
jgi:hypothetical protein